MKFLFMFVLFIGCARVHTTYSWKTNDGFVRVYHHPDSVIPVLTVDRCDMVSNFCQRVYSEGTTLEVAK